MVETSVGRVIVNEIIPEEVGYFNDIISKKTLRGIITDVIKTVGVARACEFLDGIKNLGYRMAYVGGLSFNLGDIIIPEEKRNWFAAETKKWNALPMIMVWVSSRTTNVITRSSILGHTSTMTFPRS